MGDRVVVPNIEPPQYLLTSETSHASPFQITLREVKAELPTVLDGPLTLIEDHNTTSVSGDIRELFPNTWDQKYLRFVTAEQPTNGVPVNVGVVLSGGQAAGGHNVISGIFDYVKKIHPNSRLYGFKNGPHGIFTHKYMELTEEYIADFRNMGGFHMICSGRHKIETEEQKSASMQICNQLQLDGLLIIGGDDSNTNGAVLAEYFQQNHCKTVVVGAPKTIDGDLKNDFIEVSFGFDTATRCFAESVGNLATDAATRRDRWHFIRLMGRSASNIALEVALQTRPNLTFIGEEIQQKNRSLKSISDEICDAVIQRSKIGLSHGIVLVPEGLIEFIPEVGKLISEINDILGDGSIAFDAKLLTNESLAVFKNLPENVQNELLLERDSHGNVQVAKIATEQLLMTMATQELKRRNFTGQFYPYAHYFGYEGRCANPSNFDMNYCYAIGSTAGALVAHKRNGYMAVVTNLDKPVKEWQSAGCPVTVMMNVERRKGKNVPVIKKYLVELDGPIFKCFCELRSEWLMKDSYKNPGPIQYFLPGEDHVNFMIRTPTKEMFRESGRSEKGRWRQRCAEIELPPIFNQSITTIERDEEWTLAAGDPLIKNVNVGLVLSYNPVPGSKYVIYGAWQATTKNGGKLYAFNGFEGLEAQEGILIDSCSLNNVFPGRPDRVTESLKVEAAVKKYGLQGLLVLSNDVSDLECPSKFGDAVVVTVPCTSDGALKVPGKVLPFGYDTLCKSYGGLVGNLLTDAASAKKYSYFIRIMGGTSSQIAVEVALQTHPNYLAIAEQHKNVKEVVIEIAKIVTERSTSGNNFGCYLIPDAILVHVEPFKSIVEKLQEMRREGLRGPSLIKGLSTEHLSMLPKCAEEALMRDTPSGRVELCELPVEQWIANLVTIELIKNKADSGFAPVCFYMGLQSRSSNASILDATMAATHGAAGSVLIQNRVAGVATVIHKAGPLNKWSVGAVKHSKYERVNMSETNKMTDKVNNLLKKTSHSVNYCNPGPIQMATDTAYYYSRGVIDE